MSVYRIDFRRLDEPSSFRTVAQCGFIHGAYVVIKGYLDVMLLATTDSDRRVSIGCTFGARLSLLRLVAQRDSHHCA